MRKTSLSQTVPHSEDNLGDEEDKFILDCLPSVVLFVINLSSSSPRLSSECGTVCDKLVLLISKIVFRVWYCL
jgi:hypothetical protein